MAKLLFNIPKEEDRKTGTHKLIGSEKECGDLGSSLQTGQWDI